jgi:lysylphosphatidylglycerol synthetase-like protein (DUF2156 family)
MEAGTRPRSVHLVAGVLATLAVLCALVGVAATQVSNCCGSPDPPDQTYALVGLLAGCALVLAAGGLWTRLLPAWAILICAATPPVVCALAASSSSDLAGVVPFAIVGWVALGWFLRRPPVAAWLRSS